VARKIAVMDWLAGNEDRHRENFMVGPDGRLLAIDHGAGGQYNHQSPADMWGDSYLDMAGAYEAHGMGQGPPPEQAHGAAMLGWWKEVSPAVRAAHEARLKLVKHRGIRDYLRQNFQARAAQLDQAQDAKVFWQTSVRPIGRIKHTHPDLHPEEIEQDGP
jgi:hypothetical protein